MKAGFGMNIIGIIVVNISINTYGKAYFDLNSFPDWAAQAAKNVQCEGTPIKVTDVANFTVNATTTAVSTLANTIGANLTT